MDQLATEAPTSLLNAGDVAKVLGVAKSYVYRLAANEEISSVKIGKRAVRFTVASIKKLIEQRSI
ncbi:MAG: helix-turn-helix domain-containing protein [Acidobacteria bacterium]|nr:helix-turn-helix domain-containing protein [Acidobacteriota bacterium]